mgnify:CR=1 FL=1
MKWTKRHRKAIIITAVLFALIAGGAGVYLEWMFAPKTYIHIDQNQERVANYVYRRESDRLGPCQRNMRELVERYADNDFSFELELGSPGGRIMTVLVTTYRVQYASGVVTVTEVPMGDGDEVEVFTQAVSGRDELLDVLPDQLTQLFKGFREETRSWFHEAEEAMRR